MPQPAPIERLLQATMASALLLGASAGAAAEDLQATLSCAAREGKGRVLCELDLSVTSGRLSWADVLVVEAPSFAPPLRERVGGRAATERTSQRMRLPFALLAQASGRGQVVVKARAVVCRATRAGVPGAPHELCTSHTRSLSAEVRVDDAPAR